MLCDSSDTDVGCASMDGVNMPARIFLLIVVAFALSPCSLFHRRANHRRAQSISRQPGHRMLKNPHRGSGAHAPAKWRHMRRPSRRVWPGRGTAGGAATRPTPSVNIHNPTHSQIRASPDMTWLEKAVATGTGAAAKPRGAVSRARRNPAGNRHRATDRPAAITRQGGGNSARWPPPATQPRLPRPPARQFRSA